MFKLALALIFLVLAQGARLEAADRVRMGFPDLAAQFLPLPLAERRDFLKEQGLQGEFIRIRPAISSAALVSGEIDYDTVLGNGIGAAIRGLPVRVVACFLPATPIALISRSEFKSVQDLKGKNIGLNTLGGALESVARLISKHYGLEPDKDVKVLPAAQDHARFADMQQGLAVATPGSPP